MKFLHTADWHLGAKTNGKDRLPEQKKVLDEILSIVNFENIDCVIIAGDIFNSANPSSEAEELFFDTIEKLSGGGDRFVFVLAGNHDDPVRLVAGLPLAEKHNIALVSNLDKLKESKFNQSAMVKVVETGKGHIKIKKNEEVATIAYLPYPSEVRIKDKIDVEKDASYQEKVKAWAEIGASAFSEGEAKIFVSHLFMVGSKSNNEVVKVGDFLAVEKSCLPKADYIALGHMHSPQDLGDNIHYSGAITELSIRQKNLGVNIFETENGKVIDFKEVKLQNVSTYEKLRVNSIDEAEEKLSNYDDSDIVELEIEQAEPLSSSRLRELKKNFACISTVALIRKVVELDDGERQDRRFISDEELFKQFYLNLRGVEPSEALIKMFVECKGEEDETD